MMLSDKGYPHDLIHQDDNDNHYHARPTYQTCGPTGDPCDSHSRVFPLISGSQLCHYDHHAFLSFDLILIIMTMIVTLLSVTFPFPLISSFAGINDYVMVCDPGYAGDSVSGCNACETTYWSPGGEIYNCLAIPSGMTGIEVIYGPISSPSQFEDCPAGSYCQYGGVQLCEAGTFSPPKSVHCTPCPDGEASTYDSTACVSQCPAPFVKSSDGTSCQYCPSPNSYYNSSLSPPSCTSCPFGSVISGSSRFGSTSIMNCTYCPPQYMFSVDGLDCELISSFKCDEGEYLDQTLRMCLPCSSGTYSLADGYSVIGPSSCLSECPAGYFINPYVAGSCLICSGSQYSPSPQSISCSDSVVCSQGYGWNLQPDGIPQTSPATCVACSGDKVSQVYESICFVGCSVGYYSNFSSHSCALCDPSTPFTSYSATLSSNICYSECPPGSMMEYVGSFQCNPCDAGTYSDQSGSSVCSNCLAGTFSNDGASSCTACQDGAMSAAGASYCSYFSNDLICSDLQPNTYFDGVSACILCPVGFESSEYANDCRPCRLGYFSGFIEYFDLGCFPTCNGIGYVDPSNSAQCLQCPEGTFPDTMTGMCSPYCPMYSNQYFDFSSYQCYPCTIGLVQIDNTCQLCPTPYIYIQNITSVDEVAQGYCGLPFNTHSKCSPGQYFAPAGSVSASNQVLYSDSCLNCAAGKYSMTSASTITSCTVCPINTVSISGSTECYSQCPLGYFLSYVTADGVTTASACSPCPANTYSNQVSTVPSLDGNNTCIVCPSPHILLPLGNFLVGSTSCSVCPVGRFFYTQSQVYPYNNYYGYNAQLDNVFYCQSCEVGTFNQQGNSSHCAQCPAGKSTSSFIGIVECTDCPIGKYSYGGVAETVLCHSCDVGSTTLSTGSQSEASCYPLAGYYQYPGTTNILPCPKGTYSPISGQTFCALCPTGFSTYAQGYPCTECPPGQVLSSTGYGCSGLSDSSRKSQENQINFIAVPAAIAGVVLLTIIYTACCGDQSDRNVKEFGILFGGSRKWRNLFFYIGLSTSVYNLVGDYLFYFLDITQGAAFQAQMGYYYSPFQTTCMSVLIVSSVLFCSSWLFSVERNWNPKYVKNQENDAKFAFYRYDLPSFILQNAPNLAMQIIYTRVELGVTIAGAIAISGTLFGFVYSLWSMKGVISKSYDEDITFVNSLDEFGLYFTMKKIAAKVKYYFCCGCCCCCASNASVSDSELSSRSRSHPQNGKGIAKIGSNYSREQVEMIRK